MTPDLPTPRRLVVKVGSSLLIGADGAVRQGWLDGVAADIAGLRARGCEALVVSSGAVACGRGALQLKGNLRLEEKQAAAAAGQPRLMRAWEAAFAPHGLAVAQALLTPDDTERRRRWLNARATFETLLALKAVPIVNENDTVATQELRYGDNDRLAARVAQLAGADLLVLLSDIDGLYTADPRRTPGAQHIAVVDKITPEIEAMAGGANAGAGVGSGGMRTKLDAARIAAGAGCATLIGDGRGERPLAALLAGGRATLFLPSASPATAYKAWIAGTVSPSGALDVDAGAAAALRQGKSLLPAGVTAVRGSFEKGDVVVVHGPDGAALARAVARYDAADADRIKGLRSDAIEAVLGYADGATLAHADDIVLL